MPSRERPIVVVGGGLAGCEAAYHAAQQGARVCLFEMRPSRPTPAHKTGHLAELVCSNSLRSADPANASALLKEEMRRLDSLVLRAADATRIPAGSSLAVDRQKFALMISEAIAAHPRIELVREEVTEIPSEGITILATGPLTADRLADQIKALTQAERLYFYDAISPIVDAETITHDAVFRASRYHKGGEDYINCPMTQEQYNRFCEAVAAAEKMPTREFEKIPYFEGCIPIEVMVERGWETLRFGPMKPVGLVDPRTGAAPYAVVQLRQEDLFGSCYNMVGFQTKLMQPEQRRVFRMIPGLEQAEFLRYGSLHRNTYINAPVLLEPTLQCKRRPDLFFAGQITGVEGYIESAAMGILAGINAARLSSGRGPIAPPETTAHGALIKYITQSSPKNFQPMNINFGLLPLPPRKIRERLTRRQQVVKRALEDLDAWIAKSELFSIT